MSSEFTDAEIHIIREMLMQRYKQEVEIELADCELLLGEHDRRPWQRAAARADGSIAAYLPADGAFVDADNVGDGCLRIPFFQAWIQPQSVTGGSTRIANG